MTERHGIVTGPGRCPRDPDETAEACVMGMLGGAERAAFKEHCITCISCAIALEDAAQFVEAMKSASRRVSFACFAPGRSGVN